MHSDLLFFNITPYYIYTCRYIVEQFVMMACLYKVGKYRYNEPTYCELSPRSIIFQNKVQKPVEIIAWISIICKRVVVTKILFRRNAMLIYCEILYNKTKGSQIEEEETILFVIDNDYFNYTSFFSGAWASTGGCKQYRCTRNHIYLLNCRFILVVIYYITKKYSSSLHSFTGDKL